MPTLGSDKLFNFPKGTELVVVEATDSQHLL